MKLRRGSSYYFVLTLLLVIPQLVLAQDEEAKEPEGSVSETAPEEVKKEEPWQMELEAGGLFNTGNSSSQNFGGKFLTSYKRHKNKVTFDAMGAYGRARDLTTGVTSTNTKNWRTSLRYDRYILEPVSLYALGHTGQDQPSGFDWRYGGAAGGAHEFWKTDRNFSKYELGFDYTFEDRVVPPNADVYSMRVFLQYKYTFKKIVTFSQDVETLFNLEQGEDIRLNSLTALTTKLTDILAFQVSFAVRFDNEPVPGFETTDTSTQFGLVLDII